MEEECDKGFIPGRLKTDDTRVCVKKIKLEPELPSVCHAANYAGNPIVPATGDKVQRIVDVRTTGAQPLLWQRTYRSRYANSLANALLPDIGMAEGWTHNHAALLQPAGDGSISWASGSQQTLLLPDGNVELFIYDGSTAQWKGTSATRQLTAINGSWFYNDRDSDKIHQFDAQGLLQSTKLRNGWTMSYDYVSVHGAMRLGSVRNHFGQTLNIEYDEAGHLNKVSMAGVVQATYRYDSSGRLATAISADDAAEIYLYENTAYPYALTGVVDANQVPHSFFSYDAQGRAVKTEYAGNNQRYQIGYPTHSGGKTTITDPLGTTRSFNYGTQAGKLAVLSSSSPDPLGRLDAYSRVQNNLGLIEAEKDFRGSTTTYNWNASRRLPLTATEAVGKSEARTTTTDWHPQWRLPVKVTEPGRETTYTYDSVGNPLSQTVTDSASGVSRTTAWTYHANGLVATETAPNGAVTSYQYDSYGNLTQATNALGHIDTYTHDGAGRVLTHTAPTGLVTTYTYDLRGRLLTTSAGGLTTTLTYRPSGQVATVTTPYGHTTSYSYDAAQRLTGWSDNRGHSGSYVLDPMGNRLSEDIRDAQGQTAWKLARTINSLNRVASTTVGSAGAPVTYGYDANGDLTSATQTFNSAARTTQWQLDALRRVAATRSTEGATASVAYNALDDVTKATDFKQVATSYTRDALGNAKAETSPDSGSQSATYDSLGLPPRVRHLQPDSRPRALAWVI